VKNLIQSSSFNIFRVEKSISYNYSFLIKLEILKNMKTVYNYLHKVKEYNCVFVIYLVYFNSLFPAYTIRNIHLHLLFMCMYVQSEL